MTSGFRLRCMNATAQPRIARRAIAATTIAASVAASLLAAGALWLGVLWLGALWLLGEPAAAQAPFPGGPPRGPPGYPGGRNPVCVRLEAQLVAIDRGNADPARAAEIKRLEDQASRQQVDVDRVAAQARRLGCEGRGFFSLFGGQSQQCGPV